MSRVRSVRKRLRIAQLWVALSLLIVASLAMLVAPQYGATAKVGAVEVSTLPASVSAAAGRFDRDFAPIFDADLNAPHYEPEVRSDVAPADQSVPARDDDAGVRVGTPAAAGDTVRGPVGAPDVPAGDPSPPAVPATAEPAPAEPAPVEAPPTTDAPPSTEPTEEPTVIEEIIDDAVTPEPAEPTP